MAPVSRRLEIGPVTGFAMPGPSFAGEGEDR
jgi:hypothetical protein